MISPPHVGPGRESRRRRRVSSADDSDFAPLVSRPVASAGVLGVLATTQRDIASVIFSDDECLVRPNVGRDVAARTALSDEQVEGDPSAEEHTPVVSTVLASSGAARRRLVLVGGGRRVVLVPQSVGTPHSVQDVFKSDDANKQSRALVDHFDMTVTDSDPSVPRHQLRVGSTQPTRFDSPSSNRFAALRDDDDPFVEDDLDDGRRPAEAVNTSSVVGEPRVRRPLGLMGDEIHRPQSSMDVEEDPESIHLEEGSDRFASERGMSEPHEEKQELDDPPPIGAPLELNVRARNVAIGMASLDEFDLPEIFKHRAKVIKTVPLFLKGAFRGALRVAFEEAQCARDTNDDARNSSLEVVYDAYTNVVGQATSRRISRQETVGKTFLDVQCRAVGGIDQGEYSNVRNGFPSRRQEEEETEPR